MFANFARISVHGCLSIFYTLYVIFMETHVYSSQIIIKEKNYQSLDIIMSEISII